MCGFLVTNVRNVDPDRATCFQRLRGPDYTNIIELDGITVVHNLLSINGAFAPQPFLGDGLACVYNGEIYNSNDFGQFASDGMCLLPAYEALGPRFVCELDGEFAIVIIDHRNHTLLISSDIFGTKPIHYSFTGPRFGIASYASALKAVGFSTIERLKPNRYLTIAINEGRITTTASVADFNLHQHKTTFDDWTAAFSLAIKKRTQNCREKIFISLSSGYDSGAIACELDKQKVDYKSYSIMSNERGEVIRDRILRRRQGAEFEFIYPSTNEKLRMLQNLHTTVEPISHEIVSSRMRHSTQWRLHDDGAATGLGLICEKAKHDCRRIYISGQGADEIISDYGFLGRPIYFQSNFGGYFPKDLISIYPWPSFFDSTQAAYLMKEEYVVGSFGIEARYPFLDKSVVQEFLYLSQRLKNWKYKAVLRNLFQLCDYPCAFDEKVGFIP
jgi:asparagine synthetase B (glutamine-hydrolysing)